MSTHPHPRDLRARAIDVCHRAGALCAKMFREGSATISHKGDIDLVTTADKASEALILADLGKHFPDHAILAEESGAHGDGKAYRWFIDPVDGTTNFAHGVPHFAVLLACQARRVDGAYETILGVTLDPMRDELYVAEKGGGASLNDRPIRVSRAARLIDAVGTTGFSYDRLFRDQGDNHREYCRLNLLSQGVRRLGAAGLDLAYVACGRLDFSWEYRLMPWDVAAGALLVEEAGGTVTDLVGKPLDVLRGDVLVTNGKVHSATLAALASAKRYPANSRAGLAALLPADIAERMARTGKKKSTKATRGKKRVRKPAR